MLGERTPNIHIIRGWSKTHAFDCISRSFPSVLSNRTDLKGSIVRRPAAEILSHEGFIVFFYCTNEL
jgi:hypothetical protein